MDFLEKLSNLIFYVMPVLHKNLDKVCEFLQKVHLIGNFYKLAQL